MIMDIKAIFGKGDRHRPVEPISGSFSQSASFPCSQGGRLVLIGLCLMVISVPLVYYPGIFKVGLLPKFLALQVCLALSSLGWLLQTRWGKETHLISSPLFVPAICLIGTGLLSAPATTHSLNTIVELVNQVSLVVLIFVAANAFPFSSLRAILWSATATALVVSIIGVLQYHGLAFLDVPSRAMPSATLINRNLAAEFIICVIPLAGLLFLTGKRLAILIVSGISITLMAVFLVYTRARSSWISAAVVLLFVIAPMVTPKWRQSLMEIARSTLDRRKIGLGVVLFLLFVAMAALPPSIGLSESKAEFVTTASSIFTGDQDGPYDQSREGRLAIWGITLRMVVDHPLLGVGPGGWKRMYPPYDQGATINAVNSFHRPHNDYLWIASELGLLGLSVYLWLLFTAFRRLGVMSRSPEPFSRVIALMFALSLLSYLGTAFFGFPKEQPHTAMYPYLLFGVIAGRTDQNNPPVSSRIVGRIGLYLSMAVPLLAIHMTLQQIGFDRHYLRSIFWSHKGSWSDVLAEANRALAFGTFRPHILIYKGHALEKLNRISQAENAYRKALVYKPHDWRALNGVSSIYVRQGRLEEALSYGQDALSIFPDYAEAHNNRGVALSKLGKLDEGVKAHREAIRLKPEFFEAYNNLGVVLKERGELDGAIHAYRQAIAIKPDLPEAHNNLGIALYVKGDLDNAIGEWQEALRIKPGYPEAHNNLGIGLKYKGDIEGSIVEIRRALQGRPDYPDASFNLGGALAAIGDTAGAIEAFLDCIHQGSDEGLRQRARERISDLGGAP